MCHITPLSPVLAAGRGLTSVTHKPSSQSSTTRAWPVGTQCQERCTAKRRTLTASCTSHTPHRRPSANVIGVISLQFYSLPTHPFIQESGISTYALGVYLLSDSQKHFHQTFSIALLVCTCHITYATNLLCSYIRCLTSNWRTSFQHIHLYTSLVPLSLQLSFPFSCIILKQRTYNLHVLHLYALHVQTMCM